MKQLHRMQELAGIQLNETNELDGIQLNEKFRVSPMDIESEYGSNDNYENDIKTLRRIKSDLIDANTLPGIELALSDDSYINEYSGNAPIDLLDDLKIYYEQSDQAKKYSDAIGSLSRSLDFYRDQLDLTYGQMVDAEDPEEKAELTKMEHDLTNQFRLVSKKLEKIYQHPKYLKAVEREKKPLILKINKAIMDLKEKDNPDLSIGKSSLNQMSNRKYNELNTSEPREWGPTDTYRRKRKLLDKKKDRIRSQSIQKRSEIV